MMLLSCLIFWLEAALVAGVEVSLAGGIVARSEVQGWYCYVRGPFLGTRIRDQ